MSSRLPFSLPGLRSKRRHTRTSSAVLPPPNGIPIAVAPTPIVAKRTTFEEPALPSAVRVHWSRFKKRLGSGSNPSESVLEITDGGSEGHVTRRSDNRSHGVATEEEKEAGEGDNDNDEEVDEVVVENSFALLGASKSCISTPSEAGQAERMGASGGSQSGTGTHAPPLTDIDSSHGHDYDRASHCLVSAFNAVRYGLCSALRAFFFTSFHDPVAEAHYKRETYFQMKGLALSGSLFMIVNWLLILIVIQKNRMLLADKIWYYGVAPFLIVPIPFMIIFDWPKRRQVLYQAWMSFTLFSWSAYLLILIQLCGYYDHSIAIFDCTGKDFTSIFYYLAAFPVIGLFALGQKRLSAAFFGTLNAIGIAAIIPERHTWVRNLLNFIIFIFLLYIHYQRENAERRLYTMRDRLKVQYRETQKAQIRESRAADSKKRFSSYIFHEVRVPLNTALLAVQNLEATNSFSKDTIEFTALEGSLNMMSKVLNDVLDFNRMDSGRFESVSKPYPFHKVIKSMLVPLNLAADARGLHLEIELDPAIDVVSRAALYRAKGFNAEQCQTLLSREDEDEESGLVVGDEHRLRQIVTNLTSNACKFTPSGGKIHVRTKLLIVGRKPGDYTKDYDAADIPLPHTPQSRRSISSDQAASPVPPIEARASSDATAIGSSYPCPSALEKGLQQVLTADHLEMLNKRHPIRHTAHEKVVIRIEVEDTGVGIKKKDMADNRLFSPYVQTDIGRYQGGKGTGLGLALSKHIVRLSGGRLGVKSKRNEGSTFWVELAMGVGQEVLKRTDCDDKDRLVQHSLLQNRPTTTEPATGSPPVPSASHAFKAPQGEGTTPSTYKSTSSSSGHTEGFPLPRQETTRAMRQLMEHSGQIDLSTRMDHRLESTSPHQSMEALAAQAIGNDGVTSTPAGPARQISTMKQGRVGSNLRPTRVTLPPPQFSFGSSLDSKTASSEVGTSTSTADGGVAVPTLTSGPAMPPEIGKMGTPPHPSTSTSLVPPPSSAPPDGPFQPPLNVLVVDDDPLTRKLMSRMLTRNGCNVETAENGQAALNLATSVNNPFTFKPSPVALAGDKPRRIQTPYAQEDGTKYDIMFLDNQMPVMSGVEMVRKLRKLGRYDYVVGVTGNALKEDQEEYISAGVDAVLTKPVKEEFLKNCLVAADERRRELAAVKDGGLHGGARPP